MKIIFIIGGIANFAIAGMVAISGYEPGIFSQTMAYLGTGIWLITSVND